MESPPASDEALKNFAGLLASDSQYVPHFPLFPLCDAWGSLNAACAIKMRPIAPVDDATPTGTARNGSRSGSRFYLDLLIIERQRLSLRREVAQPVWTTDLEGFNGYSE